jgi:hypothetical protein
LFKLVICGIINNMESDKHLENTSNDKPWLWKKGVCINPKGRPKGKTLKEYCREYLACMTEEERQDYIDGLPKELIWKMAEGNPKNDDNLNVSGTLNIGNLLDESDTSSTG